MDFVKQFAENQNNNNQEQATQNEGTSGQSQQTGGQKSGGSFFDGLGDKLNSAAGGGREGEKNEDYLDKGVDFVQEKFMGEGKQDDESAAEQAKDEVISDTIRGKYKEFTGSDFPVADKKTTFG